MAALSLSKEKLTEAEIVENIADFAKEIYGEDSPRDESGAR